MHKDFKALLALEDGWLDGDGVAIDHELVTWVDAQAARWGWWGERVPKMYVYPTPTGGVQLEWRGTHHEAQVTFAKGMRLRLGDENLDGVAVADRGIAAAAGYTWVCKDAPWCVNAELFVFEAGDRGELGDVSGEVDRGQEGWCQLIVGAFEEDVQKKGRKNDIAIGKTDSIF